MKSITILIPFYNEESNVGELIKRISSVITSIPNYKCDLLLVDDGSSDNSVAEIKKHVESLHYNFPISVIELSRNFGKEIAMSAGIDLIKSDALITLDADLQHPPEVIPKMVRKWEEGYVIVTAKRGKTEKKPLLKRLGSYFFYKLINLVSEFRMTPGSTDFKLIDKKVINEFKKFSERNRIFRGLVDWLGFDKAYVEFNASSRFSGEASYSYRKLMTLAVNGITSFSLFPLKIAGALGTFITFFSGGLLMIMGGHKLMYPDSMLYSPMAFFMVANTFLIGIVLISLGVMAIYIGNIHVETAQRPLYVIKENISYSPKKQNVQINGISTNYENNKSRTNIQES